MMHTLKVTLKQHTPLIHFQHDQEGATLRASEVKPKLDKYILSKLTPEDRRNGEKSGWIKSKNGKTWLVYQPRIIPGIPINDIKMETMSKGKDPITNRPLYETESYPQRKSILVLGNMGGKTKDKVLNFVQHETVDVEFRLSCTELLEHIKNNVQMFFLENNFQNRVNRGFGSFTVMKIEGEEVSDIIPNQNNLCGTVSFQLQNSNGKDISDKDGTRYVFSVVGMIWKTLVQNKNNRIKGLKKVFLGVPNSLTNNEERIPSPIFFKPVINKEKKKWDVKLYILWNKEVIRHGRASEPSFTNVIRGEINRLSSIPQKIGYPCSISNYKIDLK